MPYRSIQKLAGFHCPGVAWLIVQAPVSRASAR
jgi:hypothetical protein